MPSRADASRAAVVALVLLMAVPVLARQVTSAPAAIADDEIAAAVATVKRDPNLGGETTMKMLRWRERQQQPAKIDLGWLSWIAGFFDWGMQSARFVMWAALVCFAAWLGVYLTRAIRERQAAPAADQFVPPTHVRDLDIRPESLPANIGAAARTLWDRGDHRAALSLLYRGLLSRLTHVHRMPIQDSSTEGDCLALLAGRVTPKTGDYSVRLVGAWQGFVYGGTAAPATEVHALCDEFAAALDRAMVRPDGGAA